MLIVWTRDSTELLKKDIATILRNEGISHRVQDIGQDNQLPASGSGDVILAFGTPALEALRGHKIFAKNRSITSLRNQLFPVPTGAGAMLTYSAGIQDTDYSLYVDLLTDLRSAIRWCKTGSLMPKVGNYRWVNDFSAAIKYIEAEYDRTGKPVRVAYDKETLGLDPYAAHAYIVSSQLTYKAGQADCIRFNSKEESDAVRRPAPVVMAGVGIPIKPPLLWTQLNWIFTSPKVSLCGANFKYDQNWAIEQWDLPQSTNFFFDTTLAGSLLDENRSNSLNTHAKIETDLGGYDDPLELKHDKGRMDLVLATDPEMFLTYAGGDTDACYQVANKFRTKLGQDGALARFYTEILHPAARAYEGVERIGWNIDTHYFEFLRDELEYEIYQLELRACEIMGGRLVAKHRDKKTGLINITKASLLKDFMFSPMGLNLRPKMRTPKSHEPSTAYEHLVMFDGDERASEFIKVYKQYSSATKTHNTYIVGFLKHLRRDGKFHPSYFLYSGANEFGDDDGGTVTGRLSVKDPAIQTIPAHTAWAFKLRQAFIAPPGFLVLGADFAQGELKIAACLAGETMMIEAYRTGIDLHILTGADLSGKTLPEVTALKNTDKLAYGYIRQSGKSGNFGMIYDISPQGYAAYAKKKFALDVSVDQAEEYLATFFGRYPRLRPWHESCRRYAKFHGCVRSPLGRVRHLPLLHSRDNYTRGKEYRRAINSPVQSTLVDLSFWSAAILWKMGALKEAPLFGQVHDQNLRYIPEGNPEKYVVQTREVMENLPFHKMGWEPQLKFTVDTAYGPTLAHAH